jgi:hypothetical protein
VIAIVGTSGDEKSGRDKHRDGEQGVAKKIHLPLSLYDQKLFSVADE